MGLFCCRSFRQHNSLYLPTYFTVQTCSKRFSRNHLHILKNPDHQVYGDETCNKNRIVIYISVSMASDNFCFYSTGILKHGKKRQAGYFTIAEEILIREIRFIFFLLSPSQAQMFHKLEMTPFITRQKRYDLKTANESQFLLTNNDYGPSSRRNTD